MTWTAREMLICEHGYRKSDCVKCSPQVAELAGDQRAGKQASAADLEIAKARLNEASNWHRFDTKHDDDSWCCKREKELRDEVMALEYAVPAPPPVSATFAESQVTIRDAIQPEGGDGSLGKVVPVPSPQPVSALRERLAGMVEMWNEEAASPSDVDTYDYSKDAHHARWKAFKYCAEALAAAIKETE